MNNTDLANEIANIAALCRAGGQYINIEHGLLSIDINGEYYFQGHEADELLAETPEWILNAGVSHEDYILYIAQNW
jgi:hypothetical protein